MIGLTHYRTASTEITELLDDVTFPQRVHWFPESYARAHLGLTYAPHKVAEKVIDPALFQMLRDSPAKKTAFILSTGSSNFAGASTQPRQSRLTAHYKILPLTLTQVWGSRIAQSCGATDHIVTDTSACASSLKVLMDVQTLIRFYGFDRVCVLAVEDSVNNLSLEFFGESGACLTAKDEAETNKQPSAFDSTNGGFYVGQGACFAVFEKDPDTAHAWLNGAYTASESFSNAIGQREDGLGFIKAIEGAISCSEIHSHQINIVKTHGTGTPSNNKAEKTAIEHCLDSFVATSYKPTIGHAMGASGLLETCLLVDSLKTGIVPAIKNRTEEDNVYLSAPAKAPERATLLSLAAGMGNVYSAAIFTMGS